MTKPSQSITPCLWFDFNAEEAVNFYISVFKDGRILDTLRYNEAIPEHAGEVLMIRFELAGQQLLALNGGPEFPFTPAISLAVECPDQAEVDAMWNSLTADGGKPGQCSWLTDRYGVSWQIVPRPVIAMLHDPDPAKAARVTQAMCTMSKLDIAALEKAYHG